MKKYNKKIIKYDIIIFVNKGCVLYVCTSETVLALMIGFIASVVLGLVFIPWLRN